MAIEEAERQRTLADAHAYEIIKINDAIAKNPAYIQLQSLEALKAISKDPASKIYFIDEDEGLADFDALQNAIMHNAKLHGLKQIEFVLAITHRCNARYNKVFYHY